jgi:hypothetical protein
MMYANYTSEHNKSYVMRTYVQIRTYYINVNMNKKKINCIFYNLLKTI